MGGLLALQAEVFRCADQAFAVNALPDTVDEHSGDDRLCTACEPLGQAETVARRTFREGAHHLEDIRLQRLASREVVFAALQQFGFARLAQFFGHERGGKFGFGISNLFGDIGRFFLQFFKVLIRLCQGLKTFISAGLGPFFVQFRL